MEYLGLYHFEGMPLRANKTVVKEPENLLVGIQRGKERKYFPVANFLLLMFPEEWVDCVAAIFGDVIDDYSEYLKWREKQMDVKDFAEREPKVALMEALLELFEENYSFRQVQIVSGDMRFNGKLYTVREGFLMLYTGVGKTSMGAFMGKVPIERISEVGLAGDVLTITV